jgi:hypothetical protein
MQASRLHERQDRREGKAADAHADREGGEAGRGDGGRRHGPSLG